MKMQRRMRVCLMTVLIASLPAVVMAQSCPHGFNMQDVKALADAKRGDASAADAALHPAIATLAANVAKTYACQQSINYYAANVGLPANIVTDHPRKQSDAPVYDFGNKVHQYVCGTISYEVVLGLPGHDAKTNLGHWLNWVSRPLRSGIASVAHNAAYIELDRWIHRKFIDTQGRIATTIDSMISPYLPRGRNFPRPSSEFLRRDVQVYQKTVIEAFVETVERHKWGVGEIDQFVRVSGCANLLPTATGPDEKLFANYPGAFADYMQFKTEFEAGWQK